MKYSVGSVLSSSIQISFIISLVPSSLAFQSNIMLQRGLISSSCRIITKRSALFTKIIQKNNINKNDIKRLVFMPSFSTTKLYSSLGGGDAISSSRRPFKSPKDAPDDSKINNKAAEKEELHWNKLGLMSEIADTVKSSMGYHQPTPIQKLSIPRLLAKEHIAFAAATGSGKTLAYLLPLIHSLKSEELLHNNTTSSLLRKPKRPRAVILAPTRELVEQILHVIKSLSHGIKLSSVSLVGGEDAGKQRKKLEYPIDILVATPGRFVKRLRDGHLYIGSVKYIVIDEIDTMLENGFQGDIDVLLKGVNNRNDDETQVVVTTATMTKAVRRILDLQDSSNSLALNKKASTLKLPKSLKFIEAPGLHRAVPRLNQVFIDVGSIDKLSLLLDVVHSSYSSRQGQQKPKTLIFCNTISSCRAVEHALTEAGISCLSYHGDLGSTMRNDNVQIFKSSPEQNTLICTDIASRGLDIPSIEHIIMFDFPLNPIDYLHRSGRTARGTEGVGKVTALVAKRDKVLAMAIENAVLNGMPLDSLSSRKSDYLPGAKLGVTTQNSSFKKKTVQISSGRGGGSGGKSRTSSVKSGSAAKSQFTRSGSAAKSQFARSGSAAKSQFTRSGSAAKSQFARSGSAAKSSGRRRTAKRS